MNKEQTIRFAQEIKRLEVVNAPKAKKLKLQFADKIIKLLIASNNEQTT